MRGARDADMLQLEGLSVGPSEAGNSYVLGKLVGQGAHGIVYLASPTSAGDATPVVVKVFRPSAIRHLGASGLKAVAKEIAALKALGASQEHSPHVVRLLDAGTVQLQGTRVELPWIALEHVDGGPRGTTLRERVLGCIAQTGEAFDVARLYRLARCVIDGLTTIHTLGIVHRDLNPNNIFATGTGEDETFKVGDFGLARMATVETYGAVLLGTPGYCAPEQSFPEPVGVGSHTDVFSLACCLFFAATGEPYFEATTIPEMLLEVNAPERRRVEDAPRAAASLKQNKEACLRFNSLVRQCTRSGPSVRLTQSEALHAILVPCSERG